MHYDPRLHSGSRSGFPYAELPRCISERLLERYANELRGRFGKLTREWTPRENAEWLVRGYVALLWLRVSDDVLEAVRRARGGSGKPVSKAEPTWRGLSHAARAFLLMVPGEAWDGGGLIGETAPEQVVRRTARALREIDPVEGRAVGEVVESAWRRLEATRPKANHSGDVVMPVRPNKAIAAARLLAELAQWHSEVLAGCLKGKAPPGYDFGVLAEGAALIGPAADPVLGDDDARRLGALMGAFPLTADLLSLSRELAEVSAAPDGEEKGLIFPFNA